MDGVSSGTRDSVLDATRRSIGFLLFVLERIVGICMCVQRTSRQSFQMERIIRYTQVPPIQAWTPYQMQAIAARLKTGHSEPQMPNEARPTTGKEMWYLAPMRPVKQTKQAAIEYPSCTGVRSRSIDGTGGVRRRLPRRRARIATRRDRQQSAKTISSTC